MKDSAGFHERLLIRVKKSDLLLLAGPLLCLPDGFEPFFPFHLVYDLEALFKNFPFLLGKAFHKRVISNQDIRNHLMHIVRVVFAYVSVAVIR